MGVVREWRCGRVWLVHSALPPITLKMVTSLLPFLSSSLPPHIPPSSFSLSLSLSLSLSFPYRSPRFLSPPTLPPLLLLPLFLSCSFPLYLLLSLSHIKATYPILVLSPTEHNQNICSAVFPAAISLLSSPHTHNHYKTLQSALRLITSCVASNG